MALSGLGSAEDRRRSKEAGIDRHLTKPLSIDTLSGIVEEWNQERGLSAADDAEGEG